MKSPSNPKKPTPEEILKNLPHEERIEVIKSFINDLSSEKIEQSFEMTKVFEFMGPIAHFIQGKLADKFTPEHISEMIKNNEQENIRYAEDQKDTRKTNFRIFLISLLAFIGLCCLFVFTDKESTLFELIKILIPIAGAGLGGYGYALSKKIK